MLREIADKNAKRLKENAYPGRGIVIGKTPDGSKLVQIYWIMGRSANKETQNFC